MRPRKVILLVDDDEKQTSIDRFTLQVCGYRVEVAHDAAGALALHDLGGIDLVLGMGEIAGGSWTNIADRMRKRNAVIPILLVGVADTAAANWCPPRSTTAELLERIKILIARKRGPTKHLTPLPEAVGQ